VWPGGSGEFKLDTLGFVAQHGAAARGYQRLLWLPGETVAGVGAMNVFCSV
jgi:hypothetical protein